MLAFVATPPYGEFGDELLLDVLWNRSRSLQDEKCRKELADFSDDFRIGRIIDCIGHPSGLQYDQVGCSRCLLIANKVRTGD